MWIADNAVEVGHYVVAAVPHMARVEADAERTLWHSPRLRKVDHRAYLAEVAAELRSLAGHRLEEDLRRLRVADLGGKRVKHLDENFGDEVHSPFDALPDMRPRMKVVERARREFKAPEVVAEHRLCELPHSRLRPSRIERVGRMREDRPYAVFCRIAEECLDVGLVDRLGRASARIAREELEHVRAD